jgi:hypothetical protein
MTINGRRIMTHYTRLFMMKTEASSGTAKEERYKRRSRGGKRQVRG